MRRNYKLSFYLFDSGGGRGRGHDIKNDGERRRSRGGSGSKDKIDALGRLL